MNGLESAYEKAERILHHVHQNPLLARNIGSGKQAESKSIHQRLRELFAEESMKEMPYKDLKPTSRLLSQLVARDGLNCLIVSLYPGNRGYSLTVPTPSGDSETPRLSYEADEILEYIDNEELPPLLVDVLEQANHELFYNGCVIAEVRDYRRSDSHLVCDTHHVLLRPTTRSVLNDVSRLAAAANLTAEEQAFLESQVLLATQGPLCLDPSPSVAIVANKTQFQQKKLNSVAVRRAARRLSQAAANRRKRLELAPAPPVLQLLDFVTKKRNKTNGPSTIAKLPRKVENNAPLSAPESVDVMKFARCIERPREREKAETPDFLPRPLEEFILEAERGGPGRLYHVRISVLQRPANEEVLGELYVDRDHQSGASGASCTFSLGTRANASRYIQQFTEIFTEEGRKSVKITHQVAGQPPRVTCTQGMREREVRLASAAAAAAAASARQTVPRAPTPAGPSVVTGGSVTVPNQQGVCVPTVPVTATAQLLNKTTTPLTTTGRPVTNPAISALVTSLMNSAQQFQQATALGKTVNNTTANFTVSQQTNTAPQSAASTTTTPQTSTATQTLGQKILARQMTLSTLLNSSRSTTPTQNPPQVTTQPTTLRATVSAPTIPGFTPIQLHATPAPVVQQPPKQIRQPVLASTVSNVRRTSSNVDSSGGVSNLGLSMPGLSALLAGTPSADNPQPGASSTSSLLERLAASSTSTNQQQLSSSGQPVVNAASQQPNTFTAPQKAVVTMAQPSVTVANLNLSGLNLASLQGAVASIPGLQNVQVSIAGLPVPISLSLNVATTSAIGTQPTSMIVSSLPISASTVTCSAGATLVPSVATSTVSAPSPSPPTMVLTNPAGTIQAQGQVLQLPVAQIMTSGVKGVSQSGVRSSTPGSLSLQQPVQLVGTFQKVRGITTAQAMAPTATIRAANNPTIKVGTTGGAVSAATPLVTLTAQQQLQLALQKQAQIQQLQLQQALSQQHQQQQQQQRAIKQQRRRSSASSDSK